MDYSTYIIGNIVLICLLYYVVKDKIIGKSNSMMEFYKKYGQLIGYTIVLAFVIYVYKYLKDFGS